MSEQEPIGQEEISPGPQRISIDYTGVLADRMGWNTTGLAEFERVSDLRSSIRIINNPLNDEDTFVQLGDTLAVRKTTDVQNLFRVKRSPKKFLTVETNLFDSIAVVSIDDQALAEEQLDKKRTFSQEDFVGQIDALVKTGLNEVLSTEKKFQEKISAKIDAIILTALTLPMYFLSQEVIDSKNSVYGLLVIITSFLGVKFSTQMFHVIEEELERESHPVYFHQLSDLLILPNHLINQQKGKRFLSQRGSSIVKLKDQTI